MPHTLYLRTYSLFLRNGWWCPVIRNMQKQNFSMPMTRPNLMHLHHQFWALCETFDCRGQRSPGPWWHWFSLAHNFTRHPEPLSASMMTCLTLQRPKKPRSSMTLTCLCLTHNLTHRLELYWPTLSCRGRRSPGPSCHWPVPCLESQPPPGTFNCQHDDLPYFVEAKAAQVLHDTDPCLACNFTRHLELSTASVWWPALPCRGRRSPGPWWRWWHWRVLCPRSHPPPAGGFWQSPAGWWTSLESRPPAQQFTLLWVGCTSCKGCELKSIVIIIKKIYLVPNFSTKRLHLTRTGPKA